MTSGTRRGRPPHDDILTPAEWRIAHAVRHGLGNRAIAARLGVSPDAVKFHIGNIMGKLALDNRAALRTWRGWPKGKAMIDEGGESVDTGLGPIGQISRSVADVAAAERFYRDVVGLKHLYTFGNLAFFDCDGLRLMLSAEDNNTVDNFIIYFRVADIAKAEQELAGRGAMFTSAPHMIHRHEDGTEEWMAFFNDNEDRPLGLMSQIKPFMF